MYTSIVFTTFQLHAGHEADSHTLSKTLAVYENDFYIFNEDDFYETAGEIKKEVRKTAYKAKGNNTELYPYFRWHLN